MADTSQEHLLPVVDSYHDKVYDTSSEEYEVYSEEKVNPRKQILKSRRSQLLVCTLLFLSLVWNSLFIFEKFWNREELADFIKQRTSTHFVGLEYNEIEIPIAFDTDYAIGPGGNETERDQLWGAINVDRTAVVLSQEEVKRLGLEDSNVFIWDDTKRVYTVNAYHQLHCLKSLYFAVTDYYKDQPQSENFEHLFHCLDALRQDAICHADDELLFFFETEDPEFRPRVGEGHMRQCRNFSKLEDWALAPERNACYHYSTDKNEEQMVNWMHCPSDSPYFQVMKERMGHDEDWEIDYPLYLDYMFPGDGGL